MASSIVYKIEKTADNYDSDDVRYYRTNKEAQVGYGYKAKKDGRFGLIRCPKCERENYGMAVSSGVCCWCGFSNIEAKEII